MLLPCDTHLIIARNSQLGFPGSMLIRTSFSSFSSACLWRRSSRFFFNRSTSFTTLLRRPRPVPPESNQSLMYVRSIRQPTGYSQLFLTYLDSAGKLYRLTFITGRTSSPLAGLSNLTNLTVNGMMQNVICGQWSTYPFLTILAVSPVQF